MLVSQPHAHILIINIIEGTPDPEIGSWNKNMSDSLIAQILGMFGTTISEMEFHFLSEKEWRLFRQKIKTKSNHQIFTRVGSFFWNAQILLNN